MSRGKVKNNNSLFERVLGLPVPTTRNSGPVSALHIQYIVIAGSSRTLLNKHIRFFLMTALSVIKHFCFEQISFSLEAR